MVCKEGEESENLYIVTKGEFEVSKVIDVSKLKKEDSPKASDQKTSALPPRKVHLPKRKLL